ncbi:MAG: hypothetical protein R2709_00285 [Marmoricola sp.]
MTDALVVGVDDAGFGQRVAGVISLRAGAATPTLEDIQAHCHLMLAGYKLRSIDVVDEVRRTPAGKANYSGPRKSPAAPGGHRPAIGRSLLAARRLCRTGWPSIGGRMTWQSANCESVSSWAARMVAY